MATKTPASSTPAKRRTAIPSAGAGPATSAASDSRPASDRSRRGSRSIKRDGSRQEFDRRKLASAIGKAASKQLAPDAVDRLIDDLETTIRQSGTSEVGSQRIGEMVLERLAESDPMSYLRFKIVYAGLQDPDALYDELEDLVRRRQESRDRKFAEQTVLPIEPAVVAAGRRRRRCGLSRVLPRIAGGTSFSRGSDSRVTRLAVSPAAPRVSRRDSPRRSLGSRRHAHGQRALRRRHRESRHRGARRNSASVRERRCDDGAASRGDLPHGVARSDSRSRPALPRRNTGTSTTAR